MLGDDDKTPDTAATRTVMTELTQQRLSIEALTRAHDAGKMLGVIECRKSCETIVRTWKHGQLTGFAVAVCGLALGFALVAGVRFGFHAEPSEWFCPEVRAAWQQTANSPAPPLKGTP